MRKPDVDYDTDEVVLDFIRLSAGSGSQETMIGCEILFAAGLAARNVILNRGQLTLQFAATPALTDRLKLLKDATKDAENDRPA